MSARSERRSLKLCPFLCIYLSSPILKVDRSKVGVLLAAPEGAKSVGILDIWTVESIKESGRSRRSVLEYLCLRLSVSVFAKLWLIP